MSESNLTNLKRAVIFADEEFDDVELTHPKQALEQAGFTVDIATKDKQDMFGKKGTLAKPNIDIKDLKADDYDLVIVPGGYRSPDRLRIYPEVLEFLQAMDSAKKVIGAICHGPWVLISAKLVQGRKMTGHVGTKDDLINAGANFVDQETVIDDNLVTAPHPTKVEVFTKAILSKFE
ncbi:protease [archaeon]|nr:protease [archaeon]